MIYYPTPLRKQEAYRKFQSTNENTVTDELCARVLSLPMHTELSEDQLIFICRNVLVGLKEFKYA
jgi:dTDP-4-amino-4,6-dideoxygalactose transaminase